MKLALLFLAMDTLTLLAYPFLYVYVKLCQQVMFCKIHIVQIKDRASLIKE